MKPSRLKEEKAKYGVLDEAMLDKAILRDRLKCHRDSSLRLMTLQVNASATCSIPSTTIRPNRRPDSAGAP